MLTHDLRGPAPHDGNIFSKVYTYDNFQMQKSKAKPPPKLLFSSNIFLPLFLKKCFWEDGYYYYYYRFIAIFPLSVEVSEFGQACPQNIDRHAGYFYLTRYYAGCPSWRNPLRYQGTRGTRRSAWNGWTISFFPCVKPCHAYESISPSYVPRPAIKHPHTSAPSTSLTSYCRTT